MAGEPRREKMAGIMLFVWGFGCVFEVFLFLVLGVFLGFSWWFLGGFGGI